MHTVSPPSPLNLAQLFGTSPYLIRVVKKRCKVTYTGTVFAKRKATQGLKEPSRKKNIKICIQRVGEGDLWHLRGLVKGTARIREIAVTKCSVCYYKHRRLFISNCLSWVLSRAANSCQDFQAGLAENLAVALENSYLFDKNIAVSKAFLDRNEAEILN